MREPDPPSQLRPELDPQLEAICLRAMAKKPEQRFASMTELAAALGKFLKSEGARPEFEEVSIIPDEALFPPAPSATPTPPPSSTHGRPGLATQLLAELADKAEKNSVPTGLEIPALSANATPPQPPAPGRSMLPWIIFAAALLILGVGVGVTVAIFVIPH
jgi:serine/threonine-protein kinase